MNGHLCYYLASNSEQYKDRVPQRLGFYMLRRDAVLDHLYKMGSVTVVPVSEPAGTIYRIHINDADRAQLLRQVHLYMYLHIEDMTAILPHSATMCFFERTPAPLWTPTYTLIDLISAEPTLRIMEGGIQP